jgi:hypothetical protein
VPLVGSAGTVGETVSGLPFTLVDYLDLVERAADSDVPVRHYRGGCAADPGRLGVESGIWIDNGRHLRPNFLDFAGPCRRH